MLTGVNHIAVLTQDLDRFVAYVYDAGPANAPRHFRSPDEILAFHLYAYNALAMHKGLEEGIPGTLGGWRKAAFFLLGKLRVGGEAISHPFKNGGFGGWVGLFVHGYS